MDLTKPVSEFVIQKAKRLMDTHALEIQTCDEFGIYVIVQGDNHKYHTTAYRTDCASCTCKWGYHTKFNAPVCSHALAAFWTWQNHMEEGQIQCQTEK